jgi:hypothetical protein
MSVTPFEPPRRRPLKIFAFDPMRTSSSLGTLNVQVENETLGLGPAGDRFRVVDYDASEDRYYQPVNLDDPAVLMQGGLEPTEADPRFHQQMVYAVAMKVIENFDRALGRRITFRSDNPLRLMPHAFRGSNAFYDPDLRAVCFGYFRASRERPGENLPGQTVFTCLSHDVIAHEVSHAIVHRLRENYLDPTNADVLAFHEGFSDIVAIFQHFSFQDVLRGAIRDTRGNLQEPSTLAELARQFGHATGKGDALRSALEQKGADPTRYARATEPHDRGSCLVAAVFDGFFRTYQARIQDLIRIATGGTGTLPQGDLHPDLVDRLSQEAARAAQSVLTMCIRAFEYLPTVDVTFGDYLRALVTADYDLTGEQGLDQRRAMIEAFRQRGIYPSGVASLAEDSLLWTRFTKPIKPIPTEVVSALLFTGAQGLRRMSERTTSGDADARAADDLAASGLHAWARQHAAELDLDPDSKIQVRGFHSTHRVAPNGRLVVEIVAQFNQMEDTVGRPEFAGLPMRGGSTVIASASGDARFVISKPLETTAITEEKKAEAQMRRRRQLACVEACDRTDPALAWLDERSLARRMRLRADFRALHEGVHG